MKLKPYEEEITMYFELKDTPESSRESYLRRLQAFIKYIDEKGQCLEEIDLKDIQRYILYLKKERGLSPGTINNYISAVRFFYTHRLGRAWDARKIPRMRRRTAFPVIPASVRTGRSLFARRDWPRSY